MQELALTDCYGHAGLSSEATNIAVRLEPFNTIAVNLTNSQILDAVRFYFDLPVTSETDWFFDPIAQADPSFSMVTNSREVSIISMALIAYQIKEEEDQFAALAFLVASAFGNRKPTVYPQFVEIVEAAAKDLMTSRTGLGARKVIQVRALNKELAVAEDLVPQNDYVALNKVLKSLNVDSHELVKHLAVQVRSAIGPLRSEIAQLREETDMLWWLMGGESDLTNEPYAKLGEGRAAFLIGAELAPLSASILGPRASVFLMSKALREGRGGPSKKVKISDVPKLFAQDELTDVGPPEEINAVRDLCCLNNALARADDVGALTGWGVMYAKDGSLDEKTAFTPSCLALQSFREALLLNAL